MKTLIEPLLIDCRSTGKRTWQVDLRAILDPADVKFRETIACTRTHRLITPFALTSSPHERSAELSSAELEKALALEWRGACSVEAVPVTRSTNEDLVLRSRSHQPSTCVLRCADFQTHGRGRQARIWRAAPGDALLFSVALPIGAIPASLPAVTLACGVALAECLATDGIIVQLKWPNDLRVDRRKLAGILTELVVDRAARYTLVIGVGVNLRLDAAALRAIEQPAISLAQLSVAVERSREAWIGRLGSALLTAATQFVRGGFDPFCARFNQLLEARGELVDVVDGRLHTSGRVVGVDEHGRLVIDSDGVTRTISVGDVAVRTSGSDPAPSQHAADR